MNLHKWFLPQTREGTFIWFLGVVVLVSACRFFDSPWWLTGLAGVAWGATIDRYESQLMKDRGLGS